MLTLTTCVASFVLCYYVSSVSAFCDSFDFTSCQCAPKLDLHTFCYICPCHIVTTMPTATSTIRHASSPPPPTTPSTTVARNKTTMLPIATSTTGQICLQCDETVHPHTCSNVIMCGGEEICFVDSFVNPMGGIRYRLGCRDRNLCSISGKRELSSSTANRHTRSGLLMHDMRSTSALSVDNVLDDPRTSLVCSQCCNGSLCNTGGCGVNPYADLRLGTRGPMCFSCPQQSMADDCDAVRLCGRDQMCKLEQITISDIVLWGTSCEDARTCQMLMNNAGTNCTSTCCASDLCNNECSVAAFCLPSDLTACPCAMTLDKNMCWYCPCPLTNRMLPQRTHTTIGTSQPITKPTSNKQPASKPTTSTQPASKPTSPTQPASKPTTPTQPASKPTIPTKQTSKSTAQHAIQTTTLDEFDYQCGYDAGCPAYPSDCPASCSDLDGNFCPICTCTAGSVTTTPKPTGCPQVQCLLDCGDPPKFVKDSQGCDLCQCDFGR